MTKYVALIWDRDGKAEAAGAIEALNASGHWRQAHADIGMNVFLASGSVLECAPLPSRRGVLIGNIFSQDAGQTGSSGLGPADSNILERPAALARLLARTVWGRYLMVHSAGPDEAPTVFRDPSGEVDCLYWKRGALWIVASDLPPELMSWRPKGLAIDAASVADILVNPGLGCERVALSGLGSVTPGTLVWLDRPNAAEIIWEPKSFVRRADGSREALGAGLVKRVDQSTRALSGVYGKVIAEVSGGLDSAIIASALVRGGRAEVRGWINYYPPERQGDEREFAEEVGKLNGFAVTSVQKAPFRIDEDLLAAVSKGARPGLNGLDPQYDLELAKRAEAVGAQAIFGGQGGDAVLFQLRTPWIAADALRTHGPWSLRPSKAAALAQWTGRSVWGLWGRALASYFGAGRLADPKPAQHLSDDLQARGSGRRTHPWLDDVDHLVPGKQIQIQAIANCLIFAGACRRKQVADIVSPLMTQPVIEHCLSISSFDLTHGERDRALARQAFSDRLPERVARRRAKGDMTTYYGRGVFSNLPFLKAFLMDGRLVAMGLIDRPRLEALLDPDALMRDGDYSAILMAAGMEAWVRAWDAKLAAR